MQTVNTILYKIAKATPGEIRYWEEQLKVLRIRQQSLPLAIQSLQQEKDSIPKQIAAIERQLDALRY